MKRAVPSVPSPGPKLGSTQGDPYARRTPDLQGWEGVTSIVLSS